jgi:hypothetical protein
VRKCAEPTHLCDGLSRAVSAIIPQTEDFSVKSRRQRATDM